MPKPRETSRCKESDQVSALQCLLALRIRCNGGAVSPRRDAGRTRPGRKRSAPPNAAAAFEAWWWTTGGVGGWRGRWNWRKGGLKGGLGLVKPDSPIPRFQLFPSLFAGASGPLASPHVLLRSSYPSLSVIGSPARGCWLVARGSWSLCFLSVDCRGRCTDERATWDDHPPNPGAASPPRLTRFNGAEIGPVLTPSSSRPGIGPPPLGTRGRNGQAAGEEVGSQPCNREAERPGKRYLRSKGEWGKGKGPVDNTRSSGSGLLMGSRYMFGRSPTCPGLGCRHDPVYFVVDRSPGSLLRSRRLFFCSYLPPSSSLSSLPRCCRRP